MTTDGDVLLRLAGEIDDLGARLARVGTELRTVQSAAEPKHEEAPDQAEQQAPKTEQAQAQPQVPEQPQAEQPAPQVPPQAQQPPQPQVPQQPYPHPQYQHPQHAHYQQQYQQAQYAQWQQQQQYRQQYQQPYRPYQPAPKVSLAEKLGKEGAGSRLLAWIGGAVTLLGIVLFLVLAIQRGWFGPLPRVIGGAVLGAALVGIGLRLHRTPAGRTGAFALAATGIGALYLDAIAATTMYEYLPAYAGLALGLLIAVGGLLLAVRWKSSLLATAVVLGCVVCAPIITQGFTAQLVAFLLVVQVASTPVQLRQSWPSVAVAAGIPPLVASVFSTAFTGFGGSTANTAAALAVGGVGLALALIVTAKRPGDAAALVLLAFAPAPSLLAALFLPKTPAVLVTASVALVLLAVWAVGKWLDGWTGELAGAAGLVAALQTTMTLFDGSAQSAILIGEGVLLALVALWTKKHVALFGGLGFAVIGGMIALVFDVPPTLFFLIRNRPDADLAAALLVALAILAVSITLPWVAHRLGLFKAAAENVVPWLFAGVCGLYGAGALVLCGAMLAVPGRSGFLVGHVVITVSWTVAALVLLVRGISAVNLRVIGFVLVGAAVLKLVLFDLAALDGLARVAAFLIAGLVLLGAGTRYAKLVASR
ncbi:putative membrane protein [Amycolatopsis roodepoortensis]|uniref:Membrane protein n=2 Tax=Amycolatopsis roodepoortensis TaxID=700274 RepID=A0ABR9L2F7_9PSEU|nr:putative membrane protein [Amycolatopsis roodepoortensis]